MSINVILASASPRRKELLKYIFNDFSVLASSVDEVVPEDLSVTDYPEYLAKIKCEDIASKHFDSLVIGADTVVLSNNKILGKPKNRQAAISMLNELSGKTHNVITGCALAFKGKFLTFSVTTEVEFYNLSENEISAYADTAEPYDKAGAYGIQSKGALFVKNINGDYYNVVGFPIAELERNIKKLIKDVQNGC